MTPERKFRLMMAAYIVLAVITVGLLSGGVRPMGGPFAAIYKAIHDLIAPETTRP